MKRCLWLIGFVLFTVLFAKAQNDTVIFSVPGGFYEEVFQLKLYNFFQQNHIRYTTNGNRPTAQSPLYEGTMTLDYSKYSTSNIYTIQISPDDLVYVPDSVQHCIVIRAAVFDNNDSCVSKVVTNSYFIKELGCDTHGLPAVSICADSLDLFDYECGIMVPGSLFDTLDPVQTDNYYMHGKEWERQINVEFLEVTDNSGINQICGMRTHGNRARRQPQKGLESGLSRPVVLYLNGEYWGIYFLQEKMDERYLEDHFNINLNHCMIVGNWYGAITHGLRAAVLR